jgi:hypothetical protein
MTASIANSLWLATSLPAVLAFRRALGDPGRAQNALLRRYLAQNADTAFGRQHDFSKIKSYDEFTRWVPLHDYDDLRPWMDRIQRGEQKILTAERVTHFIPTSGSSSARKLIPFTAGLQGEFNRAIGPWISDLYAQQPAVMRGAAYWSISPAIAATETGASAVPIGFDDDSAYLGGIRRRLVDAVMAVPAELRLVADMEQFRYLTLLCLLRRPDLRLISVWHPFFLSLLLDALPAYWEYLLHDIEHGTCRYADCLPPAVIGSLKLRPSPRLAASLSRTQPDQFEAIWPHLKIISCWGNGHAQLALAELGRRLPRATIQAKGLLATEGVVTIPYAGIHPLAVTSHFFEFIAEGGRVCLAHQLAQNETYEVVLTTAGGLWRYRLRDQVRVTGFHGATPTLRFLGRAGNVSDRFGEKLSEQFVADGIQVALGAAAGHKFAMLAPDEDAGGCRYTLYLEGDPDHEIARRLEIFLCQNPHYAWCRKLGQLQPLRLFHIEAGGQAAYLARQQSLGRRLGDIKPCSLSQATGWSAFFRGRHVKREAASFPNKKRTENRTKQGERRNKNVATNGLAIATRRWQ